MFVLVSSHDLQIALEVAEVAAAFPDIHSPIWRVFGALVTWLTLYIWQHGSVYDLIHS